MGFSVGPLDAVGGGAAIAVALLFFPLALLAFPLAILLLAASILLVGIAVLLESLFDYRQIASESKPQLPNAGWTAALTTALLAVPVPVLLAVSSAEMVVNPAISEMCFLGGVVAYFTLPAAFLAGYSSDEREILRYDASDSDFTVAETPLETFFYYEETERPDYYGFSKLPFLYLVSIATGNALLVVYALARITYVGVGTTADAQSSFGPSSEPATGDYD